MNWVGQDYVDLLYMDESGVTARAFKGKRRGAVSLTSCKEDQYFYDANDITDTFMVGIVSPDLNSIPPLFRTFLT
jgi:hypothetical protein